MIYCYTGTPGSGKSLDAMSDIVKKLRSGGNVIANFPIKYDLIKKKYKSKKWGRFTYKSNEDLTVDFLIQYARQYHELGVESQTLLVVDEAQVKFDSRDFRDKDRKTFNIFFAQHRKLGYNCIMITQSDRFLDKRIRALIEYEVKHRVANNFGLGQWLPFKLFVAVTTWYGQNEKVRAEFFRFHKIYSDLYDSYALFDLDIMKPKSSKPPTRVVG